MANFARSVSHHNMTKSHDFLTDIHAAEIRIAGALDGWRLRIATYADSHFDADVIRSEYAKDSARDLMVKFRLRWRSQADSNVQPTAEEAAQLKDICVAMHTVIIALTDAINAVENSGLLSGHAQRAMYTLERVMDVCGVPKNLRTLH